PQDPDPGLDVAEIVHNPTKHRLRRYDERDRGVKPLKDIPLETTGARAASRRSAASRRRATRATSCALHVDALVRTPDPDLGDIGLADPANANARVLPGVRRVRLADNLPLAGLVRQAIAHAKVHREDLGVGRSLRLALPLGALANRVGPLQRLP